jgi:hypothetical protein
VFGYGCDSDVTAPPWVRNTPEIGGDLPTDDGMLEVMAEVIGDEVLDRLSERGSDAHKQPTPSEKSKDKSPIRKVIERLEIEFKDDPDVEIGFR